MPQGNPIFDFLKENNLTDKDQQSFEKEYSDPKKAEQIHEFFKENKLTDKDSTSFYDTYFKGRGSEPTPEPKSEPKKINFDEMFPIQETTMGGKMKLATKEPKESTTTTVQANAEKKEQALTNRQKNIDKIDAATTERAMKLLDSKGVKNPTKQDIDFQKNFIQKQIEGGDLVLAKKEDGKYDIKRGTGFVESALNAINRNQRKHDQDEFVNNLSKEDKIKYLNAHPDGKDPQFEVNED